MLHKLLREAIAVFAEGVVVNAVPKVTKVNDYVVDLIHRVVRQTYRDAFLQLQATSGSGLLCLTLRVISLSSLDAHNTRKVVVVTAVREHVIV